MLYFTNSMGAAIGVLVTGFWLVPALGLPGTLRVAALINLAVALAVWTVFRRRELENADIAVPQRAQERRDPIFVFFLGAALVPLLLLLSKGRRGPVAALRAKLRPA